MAKVHRFEAKILEIRELAPLVKHFRLLGPDSFAFEAGQFVLLTLPNPEGKTIKRSYSLASSPGKAPYFELCVKGVEGGQGSPYLFSRKEGDTLQCMAPLGAFKIKDLRKKIVLLSTGSGVAPFRGMVQHLLEQGCRGVTLLAGYRHEEDVLYDAEFGKLSELHPEFTYYRVVSQPRAGYRGAVGRVQQLLTKLPDLDADFYLCGLRKMIEETEQLLLGKGVKKENIFFERYD